MIKNIPYSQLTISEDNVRVVSASKHSDKQLLASMQARGILQNLVVAPTGKKNVFEVIAGGRRFAAAGVLIDKGIWDENIELPCRVSADDDVTAVSLSENLHEPMHPADEFMAYQAMANRGMSEKHIAQEFGIATAHVKKRLRLADVAPAIVEDYRNGKLGIEEVMAFTVEADHEKQLHCYKELGGHVYPHSIRSYLLNGAETSDSPICRFVGLAAYKKAGGVVSSDLFESRTYLHDLPLLNELATKKLNKVSANVKKEGWARVEVSLEGCHAGAGLFRAEPEFVGVPAALETEITQVDAAMGAMEDDAEDWTDEKYAQFEALEKRMDELEAKKDTYQQYTDEQIAQSQCIVTVDSEGKLLVLRGLMSKAASKNQQSQACAASDFPPASSLSAALLSDLALYRQQIVQAALCGDAKLATDLLHYSVCKRVLDKHGYYDAVINFRAEVCEQNTSLDDLKQTKAAKAMAEDLLSLSTQWLNADEPVESFEAFRALAPKLKGQLVAFTVAQLLEIGLSDAERAPLGEHVAGLLNIPYSDYWRPNGDNFFKRLSAADLLAQGQQWFGDDWLDDHKRDKKKDLVQFFHDFFNTDGDGLPENLASIRESWMPQRFE
ncbi:MAG: ParB N-terminal domain-containing protein [Gammaproteobacteria bacterium]|nr:ParB N-terminal domain-containing protein [Gammaproteobacteria bacterium]